MRNGERTLRHLLSGIQPMLDDPSVTEIVCNRPGEVGIERNGRWEWLDLPALTFDRLDAIGLLAGHRTSRDCDPYHPLCGSTLPDGQRIQICRPPATNPDIIAMSIRNPPKNARTLDDPDLIDLFSKANLGQTRRSASDARLIKLYQEKDWSSFLPEAVAARKTFGCCGLTGSGKTDILRRLLGAVPPTQRIVCVEADPEFGDVGHRNRVNLFYKEEQEGRRAVDVVKAALRMYPKTIAFQECRGSESFALMRAILSGHNSFTSWHAEEGDEIPAMAAMLRQDPALETAPQEHLTDLVRRCFDIILSCDGISGEYAVPRVWFKAIEE